MNQLLVLGHNFIDKETEVQIRNEVIKVVPKRTQMQA